MVPRLSCRTAARGYYTSHGEHLTARRAFARTPFGFPMFTEGHGYRAARQIELVPLTITMILNIL